MTAVVRHQRTYRTIFASPGVQMILASYCVLQQWDHDDLTAPYWRWYWNDTPGASVRVGNEEIALLPDRVVLVPPDTAFRTHADGPVGHLYIHFMIGLRPVLRHCRPIALRPTDWERAMMMQLRELLMAPAPEPKRHAADFLAHAVVMARLAEMPDAFWQTKSHDGDIGRVLALMHERPNSVEVSALPKTMEVSPNTFLRRFRAATGTTPGRYLTRLRIDNAAVELRTTENTIDSIATRHGFCDRFHFSKAFKGLSGVAPAAYRANTIIRSGR